jgi:putative Holliday junction resolvase
MPASPQGPFLGVDLGLKRTGLAVSGEGSPVASPLEILDVPRREKEERIERIIRERAIRGAVLGWPLHMDGRPGEMASKVRRLGERIARRSGIPVWTWDERLSSVEVDRRAREAGRRAAPRDDLAATVILQGFLDGQGWKRPPLFAGSGPAPAGPSDSGTDSP